MSAELPTISIVTPCLNQAAFVGSTIRSIHGQDYPAIEHLVMDGVSTDGSLDIIRSHEGKLRWMSEKDEGQYAAIAKGFSLTSGEIMGWLNSDDIYLPGALRAVGEIFRDYPDVEWLTTRFPMGIDGNGGLIKMVSFPGFSRRHHLQGDYLAASGWEAMGFIQQESTFWRRSLWEKAGDGFSPELDYAGDFELWSRFFRHAKLWGVDIPLACFRRHDSQKTSTAFERYLEEARGIFRAEGGKEPNSRRNDWRIRATKMFGATPQARKVMNRLGILHDINNLTYDWGQARWVKEG